MEQTEAIGETLQELHSRYLNERNLIERKGKYYAACRNCGQRYEIEWLPNEHTEDGNYCGRSDRCIP